MSYGNLSGEEFPNPREDGRHPELCEIEERFSEVTSIRRGNPQYGDQIEHTPGEVARAAIDEYRHSETLPQRHAAWVLGYSYDQTPLPYAQPEAVAPTNLTWRQALLASVAGVSGLIAGLLIHNELPPE